MHFCCIHRLDWACLLVNEQLGLKYRYLQLRQPEFQKRLRFRSEFLRKIRDYLCEDRGCPRIHRSITTTRIYTKSTLAYAWPEVSMKRYGSDKPDVRFDMELENSGCGESEQFAFFVIPAGYAKVLSKPFFSKMLSLVVEKDALSLSVLPYDKVKSIDEVKAAGLSHLKPGEIAILANGTDHPWRKALGTARVLTAKELDSKGVQIYKPGFFFHWVENFPLFSKNEIGDFVSEHHPFTAPVESEVDLLYTEPAMVHGQHYDLVCNGQEVGGGSLRIHRSDMQRYVLEHILHEDVTPLRHLLEALSFGAPPHGGIALGLDRLIAIFTNAQTVRDVIAFPKTAGGRDLLSNSPDTVPNTELDRYFIRVLRDKE
ncbi:aspartyl-tRNA synthetase [Echinococcus multilocularis]|uniref:Aspartyl-tRNA synthetase n=1 Tax=Echinococcus multilocularis TaxID=6211 RepID=A0A0S4MI74_ECHMU|nr:aspartyl-tRNA synthetase [Echinococcus multilocularis]